MSIEQIPPALLFDSNMFLVIGEEKVALVDTGTGFQVAETLKSIVSFLKVSYYMAMNGNKFKIISLHDLLHKLGHMLKNFLLELEKA